MFKVSTKGDYGLLLLSALAEKMREGKKFVALKEIAEAKKLSLSYLSQIIIPLKEAGLVTSKEGREGGYCLSRAAREITIMEILETLEGPVSPVRCCEDKGVKCESESSCNVKFTWQDAKSMLIQFLGSKTLEDTLNLPAGRQAPPPYVATAKSRD